MKRSDISDYEVCVAYAESHKKYENKDDSYPFYPYEILKEKFGVPEKVAYAACERADERDYIDYGVSLRCGWLTEKGKELLSGGHAVDMQDT